MDIETYAKYRQQYTQLVPKLLERYLEAARPKTFLDLGCGDGSLLDALKKKGLLSGVKTYAVDLSKTRMLLVKNIDPDIIGIVADAQNISQIPNGSVDFLVSEQLIEHVENQEAMASEIKRVLARKGTVYLSTVFKKWYGWYFYRCCGKWVLDPTHLREYRKDAELLDIFKQRGFKIIENRKTIITRAPLNFIFKRLRIFRNAPNNILFKFLKIFRIPVPGYYHWEIVLKKP